MRKEDISLKTNLLKYVLFPVNILFFLPSSLLISHIASERRRKHTFSSSCFGFYVFVALLSLAMPVHGRELWKPSKGLGWGRCHRKTVHLEIALQRVT